MWVKKIGVGIQTFLGGVGSIFNKKKIKKNRGRVYFLNGGGGVHLPVMTPKTKKLKK